MNNAIRFVFLTFVAALFIACGGGDGGGTPGTLQFSATSYSGNEDAGAIVVNVTRTGGSDGAVTVEVSDTGSGTATSGTDYTAITTTTLSWNNGDAGSKTFTVSVIADGDYENDETVILQLANTTGGASLGTSTTTVNILNDDAAVPGKLQFDATNYSVAEDAGSATITVTRTGGDDGLVTVDYATSDGSANAGSDYTATSGTLSWDDGDSAAKTFAVPIIDDTAVEVLQTVNLTLSNPTGGASLGSRNTAILTIISEDKYGVLQFRTTSFSVNETDGTVDTVIALQRLDGSSGTVSVEVSDVDGDTATAGVDYNLDSPTTVSWDDGDTADKYVSITLIDDDQFEGSETVNLSLGNVLGGAGIGTNDTATVYIADDETPQAGQLQFDVAAYAIAEDSGVATITVNRVNGSNGAVGVSYASSDGSADEGIDYSAATGNLSWADGEGGAKTFTVSIIDDTEVEGDQTVNLTLSNPTGGAALGTPSTAILTIKYNDTNLTMNIGDGSYWVAFRDGPAGNWIEWSPTSGNIYDFPVTDGSLRYGVAFHQQEGDGTNTVEKTYVIHATVGELASLNAFYNTKYTVSGSLSNHSVKNDSAGVLMYVTSDGGDLISDPYAYEIPQVPAGTRDLLAFEYTAASTGLPSHFVIRRNVNLIGDLTGQDIDFENDPDIEALTSTPSNFSGTTAGQLLEVFYSSANGTSFNMASNSADGSTVVEYRYLTNTSLIQTGDAYSFQISNGAGTKYRIRNFAAVDGSPGNRSLGLGNLNSLTGTGVSSGGTTGLSYTPDINSLNGDPVFRGFEIDLDQTVSGTDGGAHWQIKISAGWLAGATSYSHPDLASISGFDTSWDLSDGIATAATVSTATTQGGHGSLSLVIRKTMGRNSNNLDPDSWVVARKLAHNDRLRLDIARETHDIDW